MKYCGESLSSKSRQERRDATEALLERDNVVVNVVPFMIKVHPVKSGLVHEGRA